MSGIVECKKQFETVTVSIPIIPANKWCTGKFMEKFILDGFKNKKIIGSECQSCKRVYVPPRSVCGRCFSNIDVNSTVELKDEGVVESFTVAYVSLEGMGVGFKDIEPTTIALIKIDGAYSGIIYKVKGEVRVGTRVKAVWKEKTEGSLSDLEYFEVIQQ